MVYEYVIIILSCISVQHDFSGVDLTPLLPHLSENTYFSLGNNSGIGNGEDVEKSLKAWLAYSEHWPDARRYREYFKYNLVHRSCSSIQLGYRNAKRYIRDYFNMRYLYVNNLEYEMGYLCHQIIAKYQVMVEVYHIVRKRFVMHPDKMYSNPNLMFYLYTNILGQEKSITHLCNMLHELEKKYQGKKPGFFDDYELKTRRPNASGRESTRKSTTGMAEMFQGMHSYLSHFERERKRKRKERKKQRELAIQMGIYIPTTPNRRPNKSRWPIDYGWSIENW